MAGTFAGKQPLKARPASLYGLLAVGLLFLVQMTPALGIILMVLGAALWSVILIHASFIGIVVEAMTGRVSKRWLLIPLLFYGGYWTVAATDHLALWELRTSINNPHIKPGSGFDPALQTIVMENEADAAFLTQNFNVPIVYVVDHNSLEGFVSVRLAKVDVCDAVRKSFASWRARVQALPVYHRTDTRTAELDPNFCSLVIPEKPDLPAVVVTSKDVRELRWTLPVTLTKMTMTTPSGEVAFPTGGSASPLLWVPVPIAGCGLNSSVPSWGCEFKFGRSHPRPLIPETGESSQAALVIGRALGLQPMALKDWMACDSKAMLTKLEAL